MYWRRWNSVKRIAFSLTFFKILNLFLCGFIILDLQKVLIIVDEWILYLQATKIQNEAATAIWDSKEIRWSDVDILNPPKLSQSILEAIRMNEFLAGNSMNLCTVKTRIGGKSDAFFVCLDENFAIAKRSNVNSTQNLNKLQQISPSKSLLISNRINIVGEFERNLNVERWTLFVPHESSILDLLQVDLEIHYLSNSKRDSDLHSQAPISGLEIGNEVEQDRYSVAKIDLVDFNNDVNASPRHIFEEILTKLNTEQLLVTVRTHERNSDQLAEWYRTFLKLFYRFNYVLLGAESTGSCGADLEYFAHCEYRVTFLKQELVNYAQIEAPVFGLGSPMEEKFRLINYLHKKESKKYLMSYDANCEPQKHHDQIPLPCKWLNRNNRPPTDRNEYADGFKCSSMVYFRNRLLSTQAQWDEMAKVFGGICTNFYLFYPHPYNSRTRIPTSITIFNYGISPSDTLTEVPIDFFNLTSNWKLDNFENLLQRVNNIQAYRPNILLLDLDGGEWSVIDRLLRSANSESPVCAKLRNFEQILIRLRIWMVEESQNYRNLYSNLLKLDEGCGFFNADSFKFNVSIYTIVFKRKSLISN